MIKKGLYALIALMLILIVVCVAAYYYFVRAPLPTLDGELQVKGMHAPVKVFRDRWGVPHIVAANEHDLFMAQGFVQAQDRLWQMETNRRVAAGRLSEAIGEKTLELDRLMRTLGVMRAAEMEVASYDAETLAVLQAFSDGVNAFLELKGGSLPLEFRLLGIDPEPWRPADSIAWAKMMALNGGRNWQEEMVRAMLVQKLGADRAGRLLDLNRPDNPSIIPEGVDLDALLPRGNPLQTAFAVPSGGASNNWTVHGSRTATGFPLLANDMHLAVGIPCIWYEMHLTGGKYDVAGLTLPGVPLVMAGHNRDIAWGITFGYTDCQDLYLEKLDPDQKDRYLYKGSWLDMVRIREPIRVKGLEDPVILDIRQTRHGVILSPFLPEDDPGGYALAFKWSGHESGDMVKVLKALNLAENWVQFKGAARQWTEPAVNLVYADKQGNIGYALGSRVPLRAGGHGRGPFEGWTGENEWVGYLAPDQKPAILNPPSGFAVTANNRVVGPDYPHYLSQDYMFGFRAARIAEVLLENPKMSTADMGKLQGDLKCLEADRFLAALEGFRGKGAGASDLLGRLKSWDRVLSPDSTGGAVYVVLFYRLLENTFRDEMGPLADRFFGRGFVPIGPLNLFVEHSRLILTELLHDPASVWFDDVNTPGREDLDDQLEKSLAETSAFLESTLGHDRSKWRWGALHQTRIEHALGKVKPLDRIFNLGPYEAGGHFSTVWQSAVMPGMDFNLNGWTASNRHIYDLEDWDRSLAAIVPGQSGMLGSPHYADQMEMWLRVGHHPLYFSREKVESEAEHVLTLNP
ncbi:MAG: penicillin acylase family protein [Deltaproteobacteria bacterium]|nr:penicillin acylase family protein [Deltaproteobacteria bacterium]